MDSSPESRSGTKTSPEERPDSVQFYPEWLERYWLRRVGDRFPEEHLDLAVGQLAPRVQQLSDLFTLDRPATYKDYGDTTETLLAYGLYFFPQTWARVRYPLKEVIEQRGWRPPTESPVRILDLGAGMGAAGMSAAQLIEAMDWSPGSQLVSVDHSGSALSFQHGLAELFNHNGVHLAMQTRKGDFRKREVLPKPKLQTFDLIILSFSLNEAFAGVHERKIAGWLCKISTLLGEDGLICIVEPALRETSEKLAATADRLVKEKIYHRWGPYLHPGKDPLLNTQGRFWSHEVRRWTPPKSLARVNRELWRSIEDLKFSFVLLGKQPPPAQEPNPWLHRLVSPVARVRGVLKWAGVGADGTRRDYEMQLRGLDRSEWFSISSLERGDIVEFLPGEILGDPPLHRVEEPRSLDYRYRPD